MINFSLFCKTYRGDFDRFKILKESIDKFNCDKIPLFIVCPKKDIEIFQQTITNKELYKICFVSDEEILEKNNINYDGEQSWFVQQLCKLGFYKLNLCRFYAIFDSDCYFINNFYEKDFMFSKTEPYFHIAFKRTPDDQYQKIKKFFHRKGPYYNFIFQSQVFDSYVLKDMEKNILHKKNWSLKNLLDICPYEFNWYGEYYIKIKKNKYHYIGETGKIFWLQRQYRDAQKNGLTLDDFKQQGYLFICMNNGWVKDKEYSPSHLYKLIKIKQKIYDSRHTRNHQSIFSKISKFIKRN